jgi:hypothetical protein
MSHSNLRKEKTCLNCGADVQKRFCPECGQENVEQVSTVTGLITGLISKFTHLDGKFISTIKELILRPGFIAYEYINFRRRKFLDPLTMFFSVSALILLLAVYVERIQHDKHLVQNDPVLKHMVDSVREHFLSVDSFQSQVVRHAGNITNVFGVPDMYRHGQQFYDSTQLKLPTDKRSIWVKRYFELKLTKAWKEYDADPYSIDYKINQKVYGYAANSLLVSMCIFSLLLYVLYIRHRKRFPFFTHVIFSINYFTVLWLFLTVLFLIQYVIDLIVDFQNNYATWIILSGLMLYLFVSMRRFYKQNYFKTGIKFIMLAASFCIIFVLTILAIFLNSFINIGGA